MDDCKEGCSDCGSCSNSHSTIPHTTAPKSGMGSACMSVWMCGEVGVDGKENARTKSSSRLTAAESSRNVTNTMYFHWKKDACIYSYTHTHTPPCTVGINPRFAATLVMPNMIRLRRYMLIWRYANQSNQRNTLCGYPDDDWTLVVIEFMIWLDQLTNLLVDWWIVAKHGVSSNKSSNECMHTLFTSCQVQREKANSLARTITVIQTCRHTHQRSTWANTWLTCKSAQNMRDSLRVWLWLWWSYGSAQAICVWMNECKNECMHACMYGWTNGSMH